MTIGEKIRKVWYYWLLATLILILSINALVNLILPGSSRLLGPLAEKPWVWQFELNGVHIYVPWLLFLLILVVLISVSIFVKSLKRRDRSMKFSDEDTYEEKLFSKWSTLLLSVITVILFFLYLYQISEGPIGTDPAPDWFWLVMAVFLLAVTINFGILTIKIDPEGILIGYGIFKKRISWNRVEDSYLDETSALRYGGWGLRITRVGGRWRSVYNVVGGPKVVVSLNKGWIREVVFSTKDPEKVMKTIDRHLSSH